MVFKKIITVYADKDITSTHTQNAALMTIKADGTYTYRSALKS